MKKINNKGLSLVEIIISITLVSIVMIFLLNVFIAVRTENARSQAQSDLLINQAMVIKAIETDFMNYELQAVSICQTAELANATNPAYNIIPTSADRTTLHCLKFTYNSSLIKDNNNGYANNIGYLLYYKYQYSSSNVLGVIGYKRGDHKIVRETTILPDTLNANYGTVDRSCGSTYCALLIKLPVKGSDGEDYGINLSYTYKASEFQIAVTSAYNFTIR